MRFVIDRLKERSTWLGLTTLLTVAGVAITPDQAAEIASAGAAIGGLIGVFTRG